MLEGDLLELDCDVLVSPANSFGFMDGGIDQAIDRSYRGAARRAVLDWIAEQFYGALPVGLATVMGMPSRRFPFLVVAPTMRVPGDSRGTINAYLAIRAAFTAIFDHKRGLVGRIGSVATPGLCTGVGAMSANDSASQMRAAYEMIVIDMWRTIGQPAQAPFVLNLPRQRRGR